MDGLHGRSFAVGIDEHRIFLGIRFNHYCLPAFENEITTIAEMDPIPSAEFATHASPAYLLKDVLNDSIFAVLAEYVLLVEEEIVLFQLVFPLDWTKTVSVFLMKVL